MTPQTGLSMLWQCARAGAQPASRKFVSSIDLLTRVPVAAAVPVAMVLYASIDPSLCLEGGAPGGAALLAELAQHRAGALQLLVARRRPLSSSDAAALRTGPVSEVTRVCSWRKSGAGRCLSPLTQGKSAVSAVEPKAHYIVCHLMMMSVYLTMDLYHL